MQLPHQMVEVWCAMTDVCGALNKDDAIQYIHHQQFRDFNWPTINDMEGVKLKYSSIAEFVLCCFNPVFPETNYLDPLQVNEKGETTEQLVLTFCSNDYLAKVKLEAVSEHRCRILQVYCDGQLAWLCKRSEEKRKDNQVMPSVVGIGHKGYLGSPITIESVSPNKAKARARPACRP